MIDLENWQDWNMQRLEAIKILREERRKDKIAAFDELEDEMAKLPNQAFQAGRAYELRRFISKEFNNPYKWVNTISFLASNQLEKSAGQQSEFQTYF